MNILITNDDSYTAKGIRTLAKIMRPYGDILVVAPKHPQSGMAMAITMGGKPIAVKQVSEEPHERWYYLDSTPSCCIKYALDNILYPVRPDVIVSGINHGGNYATAALYSATLGAAKEGAVNGIPSIGVSLDEWDEDADFSAVEEIFPRIFETLMANLPRDRGIYYNINFPALPSDKIKGLGVCHMGRIFWEEEFQPYSGDAALEPGETAVYMAGVITEGDNDEYADHRAVGNGYIALTAHNIDNTDYAEMSRLEKIF